jgi:alpha-N-arabinofuranosidase
VGAAESDALTAGKASLIIDATKARDTINRNIYGHFSEHLGHCIYGGLWVGEDSSIPNTRGIRNDVVAALSVLRFPCCAGGRLFRR